MGETTGISWTDMTFNPWRGCTRVSPGCQNCYAETLSKRNSEVLGIWGPNGLRAIAAESYWRQPIAWNKKAVAEGIRRRVFCASLADVFEGDDTMPKKSIVPVRESRQRLFKLIMDTPQLDWLLLTKRPENIRPLIYQVIEDLRGVITAEQGHIVEWLYNWMLHGEAPHNIWLGTSAEDQATADKRIPELFSVPSVCHWISAEPLLGPIDFYDYPSLDWIISGGESGADARPMAPMWADEIREWCRKQGVSFFHKQNGEFIEQAEGARLDFGADFGKLPRTKILGNALDYQLTTMVRVGRKAAGHLLYGKEYHQFPEVSANV